MTKLTVFVFGLFIVLAGLSTAHAHPNDGLEGLVIGGVGGAAIGHVITGTPEGVIAGSLLGGTIGMIIDAGHDRNHVVVIKDRHRHYGHWPGYYDRGRWSQRGDRHYYDRRGHESRWDRHGHGPRWERRGHEPRWDSHRNRYRR